MNERLLTPQSLWFSKRTARKGRGGVLGTGKRASLFFCILMTLVLPLSSSARLNPSRPLEARFLVTLNGFHVIHQTKENAVETDGAFDEIRLMTNTYVINSDGAVVAQRAFKSAVMCDGTFRDPDNLGVWQLANRRGFKAGDDF